MPAIGLPFATASVSAASSGDNTLIAGSAGKCIRVYRMLLTLASGTIVFKNGATALSGAMTFAGLVLEDINEPLFVMAAGSNFVGTLSGTNQLSGTIWFTQEP